VLGETQISTTLSIIPTMDIIKSSGFIPTHITQPSFHPGCIDDISDPLRSMDSADVNSSVHRPESQCPSSCESGLALRLGKISAQYSGTMHYPHVFPGRLFMETLGII
jgi:hypothetical protein